MQLRRIRSRQPAGYYRLADLRYAADARSGAGAMQVSGRWHYRAPVIYASSSIALAVLEQLVNSQGVLALPMAVFQIAVPEAFNIETVEPSSLPDGWHRSPGSPELKQAGQDWFAAGRTAVLQVPSAVVWAESNCLLNTGHADFAKLKIQRQSDDYQPDRRLSL